MTPSPVFAGAAAVNLVACVALGVASRSKVGQEPPRAFSGHLTKYLVAWTLCISGEWLGGPGVYALYSSYGFRHEQIAQLFVLGFVCSSALGCFAGAFADRFGRKRSVLLFCSFGVLTGTLKQFACFPLLVFSRLFDGAHASLLYTAFESWLVSEHVRHGFPGALLNHSFALTFSISYLTAIVCGFVAQLGVDLFPALPPVGYLHVGGWGVPFELSALMQAVGFVYIARSWGENYGAQPDASGGSPGRSPGGGGPTLVESLLRAKVLLCCALVSLFESSMFIFVFGWTPALSPNSNHASLPAGVIFAVYMMACMSGASIFRLCSAYSTTAILLCIFSVGAAAMAVPAFVGITEEAKHVNFLAFVVFEVCVGAYFPAVATLKSKFVDDRHRATVYNVFRTPMNLIVVFVLLTGPSIAWTFQLLFAQLLLGAALLALFRAAEASSQDGKALPLLAS